jgi:hypothetical protein
LTMTLIILRFADIEPKGFESSTYAFTVWKITLQSMTHTHKWNSILWMKYKFELGKVIDPTRVVLLAVCTFIK